MLLRTKTFYLINPIKKASTNQERIGKTNQLLIFTELMNKCISVVSILKEKTEMCPQIL